MAFSNAVGRWFVVVDVVDSRPAASEQLGPVHSVVVTEVLVLADVHTAVTDLSERAQPQRREGGDSHHHQGEPLEKGPPLDGG